MYILKFFQVLCIINIYLFQNILKALRRATEDKTSMCIAHRLSTIKDADEILILRDGQIVERGNHQQLAGNEESVYSEMWNIQQDTTTVP